MSVSPSVPTNDGYWVSEKFLQLSEIIKDFDPYLELVWIPPDQRSDPGDITYCYAIVHHSPSKQRSYLVFKFGELDTPEQVLARLFDGDIRRNNILTNLDSLEKAQEVFRLKQFIDEKEQARDMLKWFAETPIHTPKIPTDDGIVQLDDQFRRINKRRPNRGRGG